MTPAELLVSRLKGVRRTGDNSGVAPCPAHKDRHPSLRYKELPGGKLLLKCMAGCDTGAVLAAIGMEMADLFPDTDRRRHSPVADRMTAREGLLLCGHEIYVARDILRTAAEKKAITPDQWARLDKSWRLVDRVLAECRL